jgi:D-serine deaminase-like pyridoxal phosphate-dependent protein
MSSASSFPTSSVVDRLPPEPRERLLQIGREGRGIFGSARFQSIFEAHLSFFEYLTSAGATAVQIGRLLAAVGVTRDDGTPLPAGTVTSALSRARERASRAARLVRHPGAGAGMDMQVTAATCMGLQRPAGASAATVLADGPVVPHEASWKVERRRVSRRRAKTCGPHVPAARSPGLLVAPEAR